MTKQNQNDTVVLNIGFNRIRKEIRVKKEWWKDFLEQLYREETEKAR